MCRFALLILFLATAGAVTGADYPLKPVPFNEVVMTSDFWRPRLETQRKTLVPFAFERTQPGVDHLKAARDCAGEENDSETEDLMIARIQVHEKTVWMMKSYLE